MSPRGSGERSDTVRRIIDGATRVFAEAGFSGASVDEIARMAGVNKATIYYHVGDKESLYAEVLHDVINNTVQSIHQRVGEAQTPEEKLAAYIEGIAVTVDQYPPLPPIMMRAVESGGKNLSQNVAMDLVMVFGMLLGILEEGEKQGVFIPTNPFLIYLMILGALAFHKNVEATWSEKMDLAGMLKQLDPGLFSKLDAAIGRGVSGEVSQLILKAVKK